MDQQLKTLIAGVLIIMITPQSNNAAEPSQIKTTIVNPDKLYDPAPYGYSHVLVTDGAQRLAFISGQGGEDQSGKLAEDFTGQVRQAYANLQAALNAINAKTHHVTKLTTYAVSYNQSMLEIMTNELKCVFGDHLPAQTLVPVPRLAVDGMLFEVDAIVVLEE